MMLSILIPSNRPEGLEKTIQSLAENASDPDSYEIIVLEDIDDDTPNYIVNLGKIKKIRQRKQKILNMCELNYECYKLAKGDWIMLANDDVIMETKDWDLILKSKIQEFPDQLALLWPDDNMFGARLSCFPIFSRKAAELVQLFPAPYRRYKLDDTIYAIFPRKRRVFLSEILLRHNNDNGDVGCPLPGGRIYPIDVNVAEHDNRMWHLESGRRNEMYNKLLKETL